MDVLRTPDEQFENLADFDFAPHYTTVTSDDGTEIRIHHIEDGPADGPVIVLIHGNPTWSYLHRHMVKALAKAGVRAIAVDLVGCGRSDKPAAKADYTLARHVSWITQWFEQNELTKNITLFCQDWGGHIGLIVAAENESWFDGIVAANTGLPEGKGESEFMKMWVGMMREATTFPFEMLATGAGTPMAAGALTAYKAPFPEDKYMMGIIQFPVLIAVQPDNPGVPQCKAAWETLEQWNKPFLTLFGSADPVTQGGEKGLQNRIPGTKGQDHHIFEGAGHFIQEEIGLDLVPHILKFMGLPS